MSATARYAAGAATTSKERRVSNNNEFANCLVANLKSLNAKERDYLVRYAYQGDTDATRPSLSPAMVNDLKERFPETIGLDAKCVFAAMDYHLDWLYVALHLGCRRKPVSDGYRDNLRKPKDDVDGSLFPVSGKQEDLDLLTVFREGDRVSVLMLEAKGVGDVDGHQLARKLVRLSRIIEESGADKESNLTFKLVWISPNEPTRYTTLWGYAVEAAKRHGFEQEGKLGHSSPIDYLPLKGFPDKIWRVTRGPKRKTGSKVHYEYWRIAPRRVPR